MRPARARGAALSSRGAVFGMSGDGYHAGLATPRASHPIEDKGPPLNIHLSLTPLISLIAGILVLLMPKLLNYIVAFYLIAIGVIGILGVHQFHVG